MLENKSIKRTGIFLHQRIFSKSACTKYMKIDEEQPLTTEKHYENPSFS